MTRGLPGPWLPWSPGPGDVSGGGGPSRRPSCACCDTRDEWGEKGQQNVKKVKKKSRNPRPEARSSCTLDATPAATEQGREPADGQEAYRRRPSREGRGRTVGRGRHSEAGCRPRRLSRSGFQGSGEAAEVLPAAPLEVPELGDGRLEVAPTLLQVGSPLVDLGEQVLELVPLPTRGVV